MGSLITSTAESEGEIFFEKQQHSSKFWTIKYRVVFFLKQCTWHTYDAHPSYIIQPQILPVCVESAVKHQTNTQLPLVPT